MMISKNSRATVSLYIYLEHKDWNKYNWQVKNILSDI